MEIMILNGSPKGMTSVTMQYVQYIQKHFPDQHLNIVNISRQIHKIERDRGAFRDIIDTVRSSDAVVWAFPVYYMLVPGQYKRFIELIWERNAQDAFQGKPTAIISTSIKYMDHAAYYYMQAICEDLDMKFMGQFTPAMYEMEEADSRKRTLTFAKNLFKDIQQKKGMPQNYVPVVPRNFTYEPGGSKNKLDIGQKRILVITDQKEGQTNLSRMVRRFTDCFINKVEVVNLHDVETKGSCMGCIKCWYDHNCFYKDEYIDVMHEKVLKADILIWAGAVTDRFLSYKWKTFLDRSFCNGHTPWLTDKQVGFIISGPLNQIPNIREIFEVFIELMGANIGGFVTDEYGDSDHIDGLIDGLAERSVMYAEQDYLRPITFLGYGSNLVLREMFWGKFRFPFVEDWKQNYSKLGKFRFPHSFYKTRMTNTVTMQLARFPSFRKRVTKNLKEELIKPLKAIVQG